MFFKAFAVTHEFDLNKIASENNIPKKYTWEEPLSLQGEILSSILSAELDPGQKVLLFSFGSIVYINFKDSQIPDFLEYLKRFKPDISISNKDTYSDHYELRVGEVSLDTNATSDEVDEGICITDKYVTVAKYDTFYPELVSTVLAKSVALEKTEEKLSAILDKLESIIDRLENGRLRISDKELASTSAKIIRHEYNTIAYIMILDKPDITWENSAATEFYNKMAEFFELNDRYEILKTKTDILNDMMHGFSSISHSMRGIFLEWIVVVLIVLEVVIMFLDLLK